MTTDESKCPCCGREDSWPVSCDRCKRQICDLCATLVLEDILLCEECALAFYAQNVVS